MVSLGTPGSLPRLDSGSKMKTVVGTFLITFDFVNLLDLVSISIVSYYLLSIVLFIINYYKII